MRLSVGGVIKPLICAYDCCFQLWTLAVVTRNGELWKVLKKVKYKNYVPSWECESSRLYRKLFEGYLLSYGLVALLLIVDRWTYLERYLRYLCLSLHFQITIRRYSMVEWKKRPFFPMLNRLKTLFCMKRMSREFHWILIKCSHDS